MAVAAQLENVGSEGREGCVGQNERTVTTPVALRVK